MRRTKWLLAALAMTAFLVVPAAGQAKTIKVRPGDSIQTAVDAAKPGDKVQVAAGTYTETSKPCPQSPTRLCAVNVTKDNITLTGKGATLLASPGQDNGIVVRSTTPGSCIEDPSLNVQGSRITGFTIEGFDFNGIFMVCVENFRISKVRTIDNDLYGVFPVRSLGGRIDHSFASGSHDTGFYIGQSQDIRMDHNTATDNVSGFEIENSTNVSADHNVATGNTGGVLVFTLPGLEVTTGLDNEVRNNLITDNNRPNTCLVPTDAVCGVPVGTGVLVMATDGTLVSENTITGNDSFGVGVVNICVAQQIPEPFCSGLGIEPNSDDTHTIDNTVTGNGTNPDPLRLLDPAFAVDLAWDGTGTGNCWSNNVFDTEFPPGLSTLTC
jgi:parallel beta-helix repeat protein